jgi:aerobic carbon-monoxide dehydrogenase medium subunit
MTLPPFTLHRPETVDEALDLLAVHGDDAVPMQGGTELLLLLKLGLADYGHVVDLKRIPELHELTAANGTLQIGSCVTHLEVERSPAAAPWPALVRMEQMVANIRVRAAGTIGGNLVFSDPHSDPATFLLAAEAAVVLRSRDGERVLPVGDFIAGPYETALAPGELLVGVEVPVPAGNASMVHEKLAFHERPAATVTCLAQVSDGIVSEARVAVGSVGPVPVRSPEAERLLLGLDTRAPADDVLARAGEAAGEEARPTADANGSVDYKQALVATLVRRTFLKACSG